MFRSSGIESLVEWQIATEVAEEPNVSGNCKTIHFSTSKQPETLGSLLRTRPKNEATQNQDFHVLNQNRDNYVIM
jgi:hypothetical protein